MLGLSSLRNVFSAGQTSAAIEILDLRSDSVIARLQLEHN
jgi:hypothetical protein